MRFRQHSTSFWYYFIPFVRFWGVFTSIVLCGVGVDLATHRHKVGYFYIVVALIIFFLEITWAINLFIQVCTRSSSSSALWCWRRVPGSHHCYKALSYVCLAIFLFAKHATLWFTVVSGTQLVSLSGLHVVMWKWARPGEPPHPAPRLLLPHHPPHHHNKYDEMTDILDDTMPGPLLDVDGSLSELDNGNILEM